MMSEEGRPADSAAFVDPQTAAEGGIDAVEAYEDAVGAARGADMSAGDDEAFDDETGVDDDEDDIDLDEDDEDDDEDFDDEDEEDDEDLDDEDEVGAIDDDGNPL